MKDLIDQGMIVNRMREKERTVRLGMLQWMAVEFSGNRRKDFKVRLQKKLIVFLYKNTKNMNTHEWRERVETWSVADYSVTDLQGKPRSVNSYQLGVQIAHLYKERSLNMESNEALKDFASNCRVEEDLVKKPSSTLKEETYS